MRNRNLKLALANAGTAKNLDDSRLAEIAAQAADLQAKITENWPVIFKAAHAIASERRRQFMVIWRKHHDDDANAQAQYELEKTLWFPLPIVDTVGSYKISFETAGLSYDSRGFLLRDYDITCVEGDAYIPKKCWHDQETLDRVSKDVQNVLNTWAKLVAQG
jgi:hypothetical protein